MPDKKKINKTVIFTNYQCNNSCIFCIEENKRNMPARTTVEIKNEIVKAKKRGTTYLEFIGGEFTIRSDALELIKFAKENGFKTIMIATNGRMLSYEKYAKEFIKAGLTSIVFSIHGHNEKLHDSLTRSKGSFKQLISGLKYFQKLKFSNIGSNTTIVKQNYKYLPEIGKFIFDLGIRNSEFIFVDPNDGAPKKNFEKIVPKISTAAPYIRKCLDIGKSNKIDHWHIRYVPLCYFKDYLTQISELDEVEKFKTEHIAQDFENLSVEISRAQVGRIKPLKCQSCCLHKKCEGIWKEYIRKYGDNELKPILK